MELEGNKTLIQRLLDRSATLKADSADESTKLKKIVEEPSESLGLSVSSILASIGDETVQLNSRKTEPDSGNTLNALLSNLGRQSEPMEQKVEEVDDKKEDSKENDSSDDERVLKRLIGRVKNDSSSSNERVTEKQEITTSNFRGFLSEDSTDEHKSPISILTKRIGKLEENMRSQDSKLMSVAKRDSDILKDALSSVVNSDDLNELEGKTSRSLDSLKKEIKKVHSIALDYSAIFEGDGETIKGRVDSLEEKVNMILESNDRHEKSLGFLKEVNSKTSSEVEELKNELSKVKNGYLNESALSAIYENVSTRMQSENGIIEKICIRVNENSNSVASLEANVEEKVRGITMRIDKCENNISEKLEKPTDDQSDVKVDELVKKIEENIYKRISSDINNKEEEDSENRLIMERDSLKQEVIKEVKPFIEELVSTLMKPINDLVSAVKDHDETNQTEEDTGEASTIGEDLMENSEHELDLENQHVTEFISSMIIFFKKSGENEILCFILDLLTNFSFRMPFEISSEVVKELSGTFSQMMSNFRDVSKLLHYSDHLRKIMDSIGRSNEILKRYKNQNPSFFMDKLSGRFSKFDADVVEKTTRRAVELPSLSTNLLISSMTQAQIIIESDHEYDDSAFDSIYALAKRAFKGIDSADIFNFPKGHSPTFVRMIKRKIVLFASKRMGAMKSLEQIDSESRNSVDSDLKLDTCLSEMWSMAKGFFEIDLNKSAEKNSVKSLGNAEGIFKLLCMILPVAGYTKLNPDTFENVVMNLKLPINKDLVTKLFNRLDYVLTGEELKAWINLTNSVKRKERF